MLTNQHRLACQIVDRSEYPIYKLHMCTLCHALGDAYGLPYRLLTNHHIILLSLLTAAQSQEEDIVQRRCPLNPLAKVNTHKNRASAFAAAIALELFRASQADHWVDSGGKNIMAFAWLKITETRFKKAQSVLQSLGFDDFSIANVSALQTEAEKALSGDALSPSARASAALFAMTADLANAPQNRPFLAHIGAAYGEYIYLQDALDDFLSDRLHDQYNPINRFSQVMGNECVLERKGIAWLVERLENIEKTIRDNLARVHFTRHRRMISDLLLSPISLTKQALLKRLKNMRARLVFRKLGSAEVFKTLLLAMPIPMIMLAPGILDMKGLHFISPRMMESIPTLSSDPCSDLQNCNALCEACNTCFQCLDTFYQCMPLCECCVKVSS